MKCSFNLTSENSINGTISWFHTIGYDWITEDKIHNEWIEIEFINIPAILKIASHLESGLNICNISSFGVSFYLVDLMLGNSEKPSLHFDLNSTDGVVFVPMSNIESLSTVGNVVRVK
jgi:hypothetical protein